MTPSTFLPGHNPKPDLFSALLGNDIGTAYYRITVTLDGQHVTLTRASTPAHPRV